MRVDDCRGSALSAPELMGRYAVQHNQKIFCMGSLGKTRNFMYHLVWWKQQEFFPKDFLVIHKGLACQPLWFDVNLVHRNFFGCRNPHTELTIHNSSCPIHRSKLDCFLSERFAVNAFVMTSSTIGIRQSEPLRPQ